MMAAPGQVAPDLEQVKDDLEQVRDRLERIENNLQQVQAERRAVTDKLGRGEDALKRFEQAEKDFKKIEEDALKRFEQAEKDFKKIEEEIRKLEASQLEQVQVKFKQLKDRRAKVIARLGQVEDEPTEYDFMGFKPFADTIAKIIIKSLDTKTESNTTRMRIGIYGDWGSGKTSFLKMIESALRKKAIYPIWFQAWQYRHQEEELWSALTQKILDDAMVYGRWYQRIWVKLCIWRKININLQDGLLEILRKAWRPFLSFLIAIVGVLILFFFSNNIATTSSSGHPAASIFNLPTFIRVLGGSLTVIGLAKPINDLWRTLFRGNLGIDFEKFKQKPAYRQKVAFWDQFRNEFETIVRLSGKGKPLVVIIDDLDRCLPEDALQVLEAIKNLLDVRGCIFLVGLDRKVVEKVIAVKYKDMFESQSGKESTDEKALPVKRFFYEDYVDKIFQLAITLPKLSSVEMEKFIEEVTYDDDVRNCIKVFSRGLSPNPRRIKRVLRTFLFVRDIAEEKTSLGVIDPADTEEKMAFNRFLLAKLIVMQSEFPDVFDAITENPPLLKDLEQYYRKSSGDTTRQSGGGTDGADVPGKDPEARSDDTTITGSIDSEEVRTAKVGTESGMTPDNGTKASSASARTDHADITGTEGTATSGATDNGAKAETDVSKKDTALNSRAQNYATNYPKLPKVLIQGGSSEEAYFSKLDIVDIMRYITLIGAIAEVRPDREESRIAVEKEQQSLLQGYLAYFDRIAESVKEGRRQEEVIKEAQKQLKSMLNRLDAVRKGLLLQSLHSSGLINQIDWNQADLGGADLSGANLSGADLSGANLHEANLHEADLSKANLHEANLKRADLSKADLHEADLHEANLKRARVTLEQLGQARSLRGTIMPNGSRNT